MFSIMIADKANTVRAKSAPCMSGILLGNSSMLWQRAHTRTHARLGSVMHTRQFPPNISHSGQTPSSHSCVVLFLKYVFTYNPAKSI